MLTLFGIASLTFMMVMYALEHRGRVFVMGFALGCALSSAYGFLSDAWPFGVVEAVWCAIVMLRLVRPKGGVGEATLPQPRKRGELRDPGS